MLDDEAAIGITNRAEFTLWAIERAKEIVGQQGTDLALAARDGTEEEVKTTGNALGTAITQALLEVFDGLLSEE